MKTLLGVVVGVVVLFAAVFAIEALAHSLFPLPPMMDATNPADQARMLAAMPAGAKAMVLLGWLVGPLLGALAANRVAGRTQAGWIVAGIAIVGGIVTMVMIPHPIWMWVGGIALPLVGAWLAQRFAVPGA